MHPSAHRAMTRCVETFVPTDRPLTVVDIGSATSEQRLAKGLTHGALFAEHDAEVIGVDIVDGPNVDRVLEQPYTLPFKTNSVDVAISGQVFEHIPFFWVSMLEVARILKPGGLFLMTVPSRGHKHMEVDCWRYFDDGVRAMAAFSGLELLRVRTDYIHATKGETRTWHYPSDRTDPHYWGDTVGVFLKPENHPTRRMISVGIPIRWWANRRAEVFGQMVVENRERKEAAAARRRARAQAR